MWSEYVRSASVYTWISHSLIAPCIVFCHARFNCFPSSPFAHEFYQCANERCQLLRSDTVIVLSQFTAMTKNSETLQDITDQFAPLVKQFHIFFFWEGVETDLGHHKGYVVREDSAAPIWDNTERSALHVTHSQMCKFANRNSTDFQTVLAALLRYARDAPGTIGPRWTSARRFLATQRSMEAAELIGFDAHNNNIPYICQSPTANEGDGYRKVKNKYFHVPHNVSSIFTGRDVVTRMLRNKILESSETSSPHQQKRFVLYGLGGSGKTQFCLKFVQDNRER